MGGSGGAVVGAGSCKHAWGYPQLLGPHGYAASGSVLLVGD